MRVKVPGCVYTYDWIIESKLQMLSKLLGLRWIDLDLRYALWKRKKEIINLIFYSI